MPRLNKYRNRNAGYVLNCIRGSGIGPDGTYQVTPAKVRFDTMVALDEIDLESGFVMLPQAIPQPASAAAPGVALPGSTPTAQPGAAPALQTEVELTFSADRTQLYTAWSAIANLPDIAGQVKVTVRAEKADGLDEAKLQNGVMEPLREADLIEQICPAQSSQENQTHD